MKQSVNKQIFAFAERNNQPFKILLFLLQIFSSLITNTMYSQQELYFWHLKEVILDVLKMIHIFKWLFLFLYLLFASTHWKETRSKQYIHPNIIIWWNTKNRFVEYFAATYIFSAYMQMRIPL